MIWLETHFIWFVLYSVVGWVWEVIVCSVPAKRLVNRGFLNGPYCPIYGVGSLLVITLLGGIENPVLLFVAGAALTCTLEYVTSWAMEKIFHARWWDYSANFLNINGRVCLLGAVAFGALSVIVMKFVHPTVVLYTMKLSEQALSVVALILLAMILTDTVYTVTRFSGFEAKLRELNERINTAAAAAKGQRVSVSERLRDNELYAKLTAPYAELYKKFNSQERRLMKAFPKLRSTRYDKALQRVKQFVLKKGEEESRHEAADTELQHR